MDMGAKLLVSRLEDVNEQWIRNISGQKCGLSIKLEVKFYFGGWKGLIVAQSGIYFIC